MTMQPLVAHVRVSCSRSLAALAQVGLWEYRHSRGHSRQSFANGHESRHRSNVSSCKRQPASCAATASLDMAEYKQCCDPGVVWQGTTSGKVGSIGGYNAYIAEPTEKSDKAILLISDIFGWASQNIRIAADKFADAGFLVVVPDFFRGKGLVPGKFERSDVPKFLAQFPHDEVLPAMKKLVAEMRSAYGLKSVGCEGFCWGGHYSTFLLADGTCDAGVIAHGSLIKLEDVEAIQRPILFLFSDNDQMIPTELREQIQGVLKAKSASFPADGVFYPKQAHGWSLRGDDQDPEVAAAAKDAFARAEKWFKANL